jgi:hypothetical protein
VKNRGELSSLKDQRINLEREHALLAHRSVKVTAAASVMAALIAALGTYAVAKADDASPNPASSSGIAAHAEQIRICRQGLLRTETRLGLPANPDSLGPFVRAHAVEPCLPLLDALSTEADSHSRQVATPH